MTYTPTGAWDTTPRASALARIIHSTAPIQVRVSGSVMHREWEVQPVLPQDPSRPLLAKKPSLWRDQSSSPLSLPLDHPSWYSSAISASSLLSASLSSTPISRVTVDRSDFSRPESAASVDSDVVTAAPPLSSSPFPSLKMCGKLSGSG